MAKTLPLDWHKRRSGKGMSQKAELVLNVLYFYTEDHDEPINVMQLIEAAQTFGIASMVSCHIAIAWLKDHGYIKITQSNKDKRTKSVDITAKGKGYFA